MATENMQSNCPERFIHIADIHYWHVLANPFRMMNKRFLGNLNVLLRRKKEFVTARIPSHLEQVYQTGAKTAIFTGDFTSTALPEEFTQARAMLQEMTRQGFTVHLTPGNHDYYTFESRRRQVFEQELKAFLPPEGYPHRVNLPGNISLLLFSTVAPNLLTSRGHITEKEIAILAGLLKDTPDPVILATHYPVFPITPGYASKWSRRLENAESLRHAIGNSGKRVLYLCGHVHRFSHVRDEEFPHVEYLTTGAFVRHANESQGEFSEIAVSQNGFHVTRHWCRNNAWEAVPSVPQPWNG